MADYNQTVTNSIRFFGPAPSTKWGAGSPYTMTWGVSKWGEGTQDLIVAIEKVISNSQSISDAISSKEITHSLDMGSLSLSMETYSEFLSSGIWFYVFGGSTNAENRSFPSYSEASSATASYTSLSPGSTTWS